MNIAKYLKDAKNEDITIISVSYGSMALLAVNRMLVDRLNPTGKIHWIVVDNTPSESTGGVSIDNKHFYVLPGVVLSKDESENIGYGSIAHAKAVNIAVAYVKTDIYLVLDPDCFIVKRDWVEWLLNRLRFRRIAFFGTPYHPERLSNFTLIRQTYMYFPTAICMAVNKSLLENMCFFYSDFSPNIDGIFNKKNFQSEIAAKFRRSEKLVSGSFFKKRIVDCADCFCSFIHVFFLFIIRLRLSRRYDIGHKMYEFYSKRVSVETASVRFVKEFPPLFRFWKWVIPQSVLGYPKRREYWTNKKISYVPVGLESQGRWEEFFVDGEPFAFHIGKVTYCGDRSDFHLAFKIVSKIINDHLV